MMVNGTILSLRNIDKSFSGVEVLKDVNFELKQGEVHALVGENGAGKSTLIKILTGAYRRDNGTITYLGEELEHINPIQTRVAGINAIYQELTLFKDMPVYQNLFLGAEIARCFTDDNAMIAKSESILASLGVAIDPRVNAGDLNIANQQMVEIARALLFDTRILIMDEPTSSISENEARRLFKKISTLKRAGVSIIYISHRLSEIFDLCETVSVLRDGALVVTKPITAIKDEDELVSYMIGKNMSSRFPKRPIQPGKEVLRVHDLGVEGVFSGVDFSVAQGEILGIGGLVGSKRSEIVETIFGLREHTHGTMYLHGTKLRKLTPLRAIQYGMAFVTEDRKRTGLFLQMKIHENITMPFLDSIKKLLFIDTTKERQLVSDCIEAFKIKTPSSDQVIEKLSGGNQQKVLIARWISAKPVLLMLDEPTRGIDVQAKTEIYALMGELARQGIAIIMISSELPELVAMSDRILVMHAGRQMQILRGGAYNEIDAKNVLRLAFGGHVE